MAKQILLLTPQLPYPPHSGASLRNYYILKGVSQIHTVSLISFANPTAANRPAPKPLAEICRQIELIPTPNRPLSLRARQLLFSRQPDMGRRLTSPTFERRLSQLLATNHYDVVQVEGIELAQYIPTIRQINPHALILFDNHNAETALQRRTFLTDLRQARRWIGAAYSWLQSRRLQKYEAWALAQADIVTVVSQADQEELQPLAPAKTLTVIPNCIDVAAYENISSDGVPSFDLLFLGKMDYRPNVDAILYFMAEIWEKIRGARPQTTLGIIGQKPHSRLAQVTEADGVTITGFVERIEPYLAGAKIGIMPFRIGSGTRLKLIQMMAAGKPIVSSPLGAEGFPVTNNQQLMIADSPSEFASTVLTLLNQPNRRQEIGASAQQFAQRYDWRQIIPKMAALYQKKEAAESAAS